MSRFDVIVVGGGVIGNGMASCIKSSSILKHLKVALIEANDAIIFNNTLSFSNRVSSINSKSMKLLKNSSAIDHLDIKRIKSFNEIHVWDGDGRIDFNRSNDNLGTIIENNNLVNAFQQTCKNSSVDLIYNTKVSQLTTFDNYVSLQLNNGTTMESSLVIGSDGANSQIRNMAGIQTKGWSYNQRALVGTLDVQTSTDNSSAWQRFLPTGPIAMLPLSEDKSSLVWTIQPEMATKLTKLDSDSFVHLLNAAFELPFADIKYFISKIDPETNQFSSSFNIEEEINWRRKVYARELVNNGGGLFGVQQNQVRLPPVIVGLEEGSRGAFPLKLQKAIPYVKNRVALIGDAAHVIHPMAGLGMNIGLGDVSELITILENAVSSGQDIGSNQVLSQYNENRMLSNVLSMGTMDMLWNIYHNENLSTIRSFGMNVLNIIPFVKNEIQRQAMNL